MENFAARSLRNNRWKPVAALILLIGTVSGLLVSLDRASRNMVIRAGYSQFAPYVIVTKSGEPGGLAVDVVRRAAENAGIPLRWVRVNDIDTALASGQIDVYPLASLNPERNRDFHASEPWWDNEIALISAADRPLANAAETSGKRVAVRGFPAVKRRAEILFPLAQLVIIPQTPDMVKHLCSGSVDGIFLDLRLLEAQLLDGSAPCAGHSLHVASIPDSSMPLGTLARHDASRAADRLYRAIADLSSNGFLAEEAAKWSLYNPYRSRHFKDILEAQHRAVILRYGLGGMILVVILISIQTHRVRRAHFLAESAREAAVESNERFNAFMRNMPCVAFIKTASGHFSFANTALCELFQREPSGFLGKTDFDLFPAEEARRYRDNDLRVIAGQRVESLQETAIDSEGRERAFISYKFPFTNHAGETFLGGVAIDISERLRAEEALRLSQFSIDCSDDIMLWIDSGGLISNANRAAFRHLGYTREELIGSHIAEIDQLISRAGFCLSREELKRAGSLSVESVYRRKDGGTYPVEIRHNFLDFQGTEYTCCISRDITDRRRAEVEMTRQANHDALTGLPNRRSLESGLNAVIQQAQRQSSCAAVIYLDLDGFKLVNDTLGHAVGDRLLKQVASRLRSSLPEDALLFRMGGDEFAAVLSGFSNQDTVAIIAHKLLAQMRDTYLVDSHELSITTSAGISLFPRDGNEESKLLIHADIAMYESKRQGKNRMQFFSPELGESVRERLDLENHLRRALDRDEFSLVFQPEFSLATGRIVRHEALLRWTHPVLGNVSPSQFIPVAEETTLIVTIGRWVLEEACRRARDWQTSAPNVGVAVNVSVCQFDRPDFLDSIHEVLRATGLPAHLLELELTESVVMLDMEDVKAKIATLRDLGVTVSLDDFGTGYSCMSYLRQLRIDSLKIDRSFIRDLETDPASASLASALISIAHSLGMKVVVEGIETEAQLAIVSRLGCEIGQGYLLGKPSPTPLMLEQFAAA